MKERERNKLQRKFAKGGDRIGNCAICGRVRPLVADHKQPVTLHGQFTEDNKQRICAKCHGKKTQRERTSPFEFIP